MTSEVTAKVRVVRCPKCRLLLPESIGVLLYKCGGCGTVLQAKNRQNDVINQISGLQETNLAQLNEVEHASGDEECSSSSQTLSHPSIGQCSLDESNGRDQNESGDCNGQQCAVTNLSKEASSSTELMNQKNEESSLVAGANTELHEKRETGCDFRSSITDNPLDTREGSSTISARMPIGESILLDAIMSPSNVQPEQPQRSVIHRFTSVRSTSKLETIAVVNPSSELCGILQDMPKSPTTGSCHAYDGSVSSYDGTDDQVPDHNPPQSKTFKVSDYVNTEERPKRGKLLVNSKSEMEHQARNSFSISSDKKHYAMKCSSYDRDKLLEPSRRGSPLIRNRLRMERDEFPCRVPFYLSGSQASYEFGSPSTRGLDEFQYSSSFHSPDKHESAEQDKMKLLRMVCELKDQLHRAYALNGKANGRVPAEVTWKEKQIPLYNDKKSPEEEICHDSSHPRCPGRCRRVKNWPQQHKFSRMAFSGDAINSRFHVDHSCLHCCPNNCQWSVQPLPPFVCCNKGLCWAHTGLGCYSTGSSSPSSPHRYMDSDFLLRSRGTKSDDLRHQDHEVKKFYLREKHQSLKRHFRPIAGGAPFITCYRCLKLLQLPADFLLFRRRCHQLRCSACSEVLAFSLQNRTHIVPYAQRATDPPPGEVDDSSGAMNARILASAACANDCLHVDPVSCSDDYGLSFCKSCSTEGETAALMLPFPVLQSNADNENMPSGSSSEPMKDGKKNLVWKQTQNKYGSLGETHELAWPSSDMSGVGKFSSEIEELPPATGSPLHRLMGYSSPSELINGSGAGTSSYYAEKSSRSGS